MDVKHQIHRLLRRLGWDIRKLENSTLDYQAIKDLLRASNASVILDIGANLGQYGDLVLDAGFKGTLVSFEAIEALHAELTRHSIRRSRTWKVAPCKALGSQRRQATIHIAGNAASSSILPMLPAHVSALPQSAYVGSQVVQVERLDFLAPPLVPPNEPLLLKIDTQGYEMEVLRGATGLLPLTVALQIELSLVPLYDGAPDFVEAVQYVQALGFSLFSLIPGFKDKRTGRLLQVDGMFLRDHASNASARHTD